MKLSPVWPAGAALPLILLLLSFCTPAHADSYTVYNLGNANYNTIYGIDTSGQVVVQNNAFCGDPGGSCYTTYANGAAVAVTNLDIAPSLDYDNGSACGWLPSGFDITKSTCNNGWIGFGSIYNPNGRKDGIYTGLDSSPTFLQTGSGDRLVLNASGDFAWVDGSREYIYEAVDTTVPEPSSILLMGTGVIVLTSMLRRRLRA